MYSHRKVNTMAVTDTDVKKVFRQHNSLIVVVPMYLRLAWDIKPGDFLVFEKRRGGRSAMVRKFEGSKTRGRRGTGHPG